MRAHQEELRRQAEARRAQGELLPSALRRRLRRWRGKERGGGEPRTVLIRMAARSDTFSLLALSWQSQDKVVAGPLLVAEQDGAVKAALSLSTGAMLVERSEVARALLELLRVRAAQLRAMERESDRSELDLY
jgi:hypothetical protein